MASSNAGTRTTSRPPSSRRGYGAEWRKVRASILAAYGIPRDQWHRYHVDHRPPYNPDIEPDHTKYQLVPMLAGDHSRKTIREDGGFGRPKQGGKPRIHSVEPQPETITTSRTRVPGDRGAFFSESEPRNHTAKVNKCDVRFSETFSEGANDG